MAHEDFEPRLWLEIWNGRVGGGQGAGRGEAQQRQQMREGDQQQIQRQMESRSSNPRMAITSNHRNLAVLIKDTIEADPEIDNLPDFWYAQLALVNGDDVDAALEQAASMQYLREEYGIRDTMTDAKKVIWDFLHLYEDWLQSFCYIPNLDSMFVVIDLAACDGKAYDRPNGWKTALAGQYYLRQAVNPDLVCVQNGASTIFECRGFEWAKTGGISAWIRMSKEVFGPYPQLTRNMTFYHTGR